MASTRRLAAILAADVAGYSRLMGADEEGTHERLKAHLGELVNPKVREHRGRIVKNTGDGFLAEFQSVVDAVRCAAEIQHGMIDREPQVADERRIRFRIGINLGDVIAEPNDIFGDGVNVAARLEALAEPGGICVSRVVRDQVRDRLDYTFEDLGEQQVKNIARPVRVYALRSAAVDNPPASRVVKQTRRSDPHVGHRSRQRRMAADAVGVPLDAAGAACGWAAALALCRDAGWLPAGGGCLSSAGLAPTVAIAATQPRSAGDRRRQHRQLRSGAAWQPAPSSPLVGPTHFSICPARPRRRSIAAAPDEVWGWNWM
jgi:class 3 adenylate cyclase